MSQEEIPVEVLPRTRFEDLTSPQLQNLLMRSKGAHQSFLRLAAVEKDIEKRVMYQDIANDELNRATRIERILQGRNGRARKKK